MLIEALINSNLTDINIILPHAIAQRLCSDISRLTTANLRDQLRPVFSIPPRIHTTFDDIPWLIEGMTLPLQQRCRRWNPLFLAAPVPQITDSDSSEATSADATSTVTLDSPKQP